MSTQANTANTNKPCAFCSKPIRKTQKANLHHGPVYRSQGGKTVQKVHETCHRNFHHSQGDFAAWGKLSALDGHWAFTLRGVRESPLYQPVRDFYSLYYSKPESRKERQ